ncbi:hypothetical protein CHLNCDRAFT_144331 [Chlorella variabilis]|uniref:LYR motif-containing protein 2 n=1 Tax=Chlorella variabilis TaxID=554065 RepID=E1ZCF5_CHLVA|nr:hypothetical protein CHLNCDRAFT_144331 [Chlorella variabilis]EFN56806.1 hypothetical protein CHLNCDRAFT_144331 [Chlorella variabilis]|eukprot:XP_005848908.1 hypothetical protein CHLNCDRAFT_144331 [Chlorella variabilis]
MQVLHLYRQLLRVTKGARDPAARAELRHEIRQQFDAHRGPQEQHSVRFLLSDGRLKLKQLGEMLGMQQ